MSVNVILTWRTEVFHLSGSRLAMQNFVLYSFKTGLLSQCLSKTHNPWETCNYPSTTNLSNVEKHQVQASFTSTAQDVLTFTYQFQDSKKLLLSHLSLFVSGDYDIGSNKYSNSTFGA